MKIILLIFFALLLVGCCPPKYKAFSEKNEPGEHRYSVGQYYINDFGSEYYEVIAYYPTRAAADSAALSLNTASEEKHKHDFHEE